MSSIGPSLPPHLAKRKRTPDDDGTSADTPPAKIRASESGQTSNKDEIDLEDSDSDDGYRPSASIGPSIGPSAYPPRVAGAGPSLPQPPQQNTDEIPLESEDEDEDDMGPAPSGPAPPPAKRTMGPSLPPPPPTTNNTNEIPLDSEDEDVGPSSRPVGPTLPPSTSEPKRIHGPAPPPAPLSERPSQPANPDPDPESDSDSDYGPSLPTSTTHLQAAARARALAAEADSNPSAPKRDDWMLAPPTSDGYRGAADPTKLKARKFNSGPRANTSSSAPGEISSIWTETPEEKRKRLENAVLGRDSSSGSGPGSAASSNKSRAKTAPTAEEEAQAARIKSFTEATRGQSLYDSHQATRAQGKSTPSRSTAKKGWTDEEDDDPSKRAFDKEKDMKLGGRIGASQRRELLNKAADFGGRFAKGKYL
ncbi:hypothetical protein F5Y16DRAFT_383448 [Xylariaceae sp. FL0255]|nr:hypothetical protein F5Y16DRAFT_383448 [Xylariaceae sp. FL0255]